MDMDFAVSRPLVRRSRLVSDFCPSTRTFALRFLQTSPRGDSPCVITNPSPPSGWVEDLHLLAADHAQHTTKPLARRTLRVLHSASHAAPRGLVSRFSLLLDFGNYCKVCRLQARIDSIPIADSPHPPQTPAASFKRLYRTRARASCSRLTLRRKRASDRALTSIETFRFADIRYLSCLERLL